MTEPAPAKRLTDALTASIEARQIRSPEQYKLDLLAKELPEIKKALAGATYLLNIAVANTRETAAESMVLRQQMNALMSEMEDLKAAMGSHQMTIEAHSERIEKMAQWAKTKGHEL